MSEDKAWNTGNKLSQEHQGQKHGVLQKAYKDKQSHRVTCERNTSGRLAAHFTDQFEHPRAAAARSEASEQSENNDDGSGPDEDIWCIGALLRRQREIGLQAHLPPHPDSQQDHACELRKTAGRVRGRASKSLGERRAGFVRGCLPDTRPKIKGSNPPGQLHTATARVQEHCVESEAFWIRVCFQQFKKKKATSCLRSQILKKNMENKNWIRFIDLGFNKYGCFYRKHYHLKHKFQITSCSQRHNHEDFVCFFLCHMRYLKQDLEVFDCLLPFDLNLGIWQLTWIGHISIFSDFILKWKRKASETRADNSY